ncbi:MAG: GIY-YIG nuclease family protein [Gammaproteobacteria bacterium]|jgi:putative endonuclease
MNLETGKKLPWHVYMVRCSDNSLYTGIAKSLEKRLQEHNGDNRNGARYTRSRRPVTLVYHESHASRAQAARREVEIKRMSKKHKEALVFSSKSAPKKHNHKSR